MNRKIDGWVRWLRGRDGATLIEYALLAGGISLACVAAALAFSDSFNTMLETLSNVLSDAAADIGF